MNDKSCADLQRFTERSIPTGLDRDTWLGTVFLIIKVNVNYDQNPSERDQRTFSVQNSNRELTVTQRNAEQISDVLMPPKVIQIGWRAIVYTVQR